MVESTMHVDLISRKTIVVLESMKALYKTVSEGKYARLDLEYSEALNEECVCVSTECSGNVFEGPRI